MSEYLSDRQDIWYGTSLDLKTPFLMVFTDPPPFSTPTQLYHPGQTPKTRVQRPEKLKSGDRFLEWYSVFYDVFLLSRSRKSLSESFPTVSRPLWWPDGAISKIWSSHKYEEGGPSFKTWPRTITTSLLPGGFRNPTHNDQFVTFGGSDPGLPLPPPPKESTDKISAP